MTIHKRVLPVLMVALLSVAGCDSLLEVVDPDLVTPDNVVGEKGAELFWAGALGQFATAYSSGAGGQALYSGMLADEFLLSGTFPTRFEVDRREMDVRNGTLLGQYRNLHQARVGLKNAAEKLEEFLPGDTRIGELWNLNGFTYLFFAENYCSGVPFSSANNDGSLVYSGQVPTAEMLTTAIQRFQAGAAAGGTGDQANLAAIGLGRAYLNQGDYASAANAVASVPDEWTYQIRSKSGGTNGQRNAIFEQNHSQRRWSLSDMEGGNGVAFRTATDSRVPWEDAGSLGFDQTTPLIHQLKYASADDDVVLASGIEARLIEAEANLNGAGDTWLTTLNDLRAAEGLSELVDPGTLSEQVDMLFDERARWLFGTSHRLGDLRRLVRQYGRDGASVFPSGVYFKGGTYGGDMNFPIPFEESSNEELPGLTNQICLDRSA